MSQHSNHAALDAAQTRVTIVPLQIPPRVSNATEQAAEVTTGTEQAHGEKLEERPFPPDTPAPRPEDTPVVLSRRTQSLVKILRRGSRGSTDKPPDDFHVTFADLHNLHDGSISIVTSKGVERRLSLEVMDTGRRRSAIPPAPVDLSPQSLGPVSTQQLGQHATSLPNTAARTSTASPSSPSAGPFSSPLTGALTSGFVGSSILSKVLQSGKPHVSPQPGVTGTSSPHAFPPQKAGGSASPTSLASATSSQNQADSVKVDILPIVAPTRSSSNSITSASGASTSAGQDSASSASSRHQRRGVVTVPPDSTTLSIAAALNADLDAPSPTTMGDSSPASFTTSESNVSSISNQSARLPLRQRSLTSYPYAQNQVPHQLSQGAVRELEQKTTGPSPVVLPVQGTADPDGHDRRHRPSGIHIPISGIFSLHPRDSTSVPTSEAPSPEPEGDNDDNEPEPTNKRASFSHMAKIQEDIPEGILLSGHFNLFQGLRANASSEDDDDGSESKEDGSEDESEGQTKSKIVLKFTSDLVPRSTASPSPSPPNASEPRSSSPPGSTPMPPEPLSMPVATVEDVRGSSKRTTKQENHGSALLATNSMSSAPENAVAIAVQLTPAPPTADSSAPSVNPASPSSNLVLDNPFVSGRVSLNSPSLSSTPNRGLLFVPLPTGVRSPRDRPIPTPSPPPPPPDTQKDDPRSSTPGSTGCAGRSPPAQLTMPGSPKEQETPSTPTSRGDSALQSETLQGSTSSCSGSQSRIINDPLPLETVGPVRLHNPRSVSLRSTAHLLPIQQLIQEQTVAHSGAFTRQLHAVGIRDRRDKVISSKSTQSYQIPRWQGTRKRRAFRNRVIQCVRFALEEGILANTSPYDAYATALAERTEQLLAAEEEHERRKRLEVGLSPQELAIQCDMDAEPRIPGLPVPRDRSLHALQLATRKRLARSVVLLPSGSGTLYYHVGDQTNEFYSKDPNAIIMTNTLYHETMRARMYACDHAAQYEHINGADSPAVALCMSLLPNLARMRLNTLDAKGSLMATAQNRTETRVLPGSQNAYVYNLGLQSTGADSSASQPGILSGTASQIAIAYTIALPYYQTVPPPSPEAVQHGFSAYSPHISRLSAMLFNVPTSSLPLQPHITQGLHMNDISNASTVSAAVASVVRCDAALLQVTSGLQSSTSETLSQIGLNSASGHSALSTLRNSTSSGVEKGVSEAQSTSEKELLFTTRAPPITSQRNCLVNAYSTHVLTRVEKELSEHAYVEQACIQQLRRGSFVYKFKNKEPTRRVLFLSDDGSSICWQTLRRKEEKEMMLAEAKGGSAGSTFESNVSCTWFGGKSIPLADVVGVYYGPYYSQELSSFLNSCDNGRGKSWLALTIETVDDELNFVFVSLADLKLWINALHALTPASSRSITPGRAFWTRVIMKLNKIGLARFTRDADRDWSKELSEGGVV